MSETAVSLWFTGLSHGQWVSPSLHLPAGLWIKSSGNTDTPSSAECILPGPTVFKARQWLANWWRENIVFLPSHNVVRLCGERGKDNTVWNTRPWEQMSTKCYSLLTELPVDFKKQRLLTRLHGLQAPRADDGEREMGEVHRERCGAWGGIRSGQHFWKIHLTAAGGTGWEWEHQV